MSPTFSKLFIQEREDLELKKYLRSESQKERKKEGKRRERERKGRVRQNREKKTNGRELPETKT